MNTQVIGVVGGIGAGKSTIVKLLKESMPSFVIGADEIGHGLLLKEGQAYAKVIETFGKDIVDQQGNIIRSQLGRIVFNDLNQLKKLNQITHPLILKEVKKQIQSCKKQNKWSLIIIDAALLIEIGLVSLTDYVIGVYADEDVRIKRIMKREGLLREEVENRINKQKNWKELEKIADFIISNNRNEEETKKEVQNLIVKLQG